jgi:hypothetical protein
MQIRKALANRNLFRIYSVTPGSSVNARTLDVPTYIDAATLRATSYFSVDLPFAALPDAQPGTCNDIVLSNVSHISFPTALPSSFAITATA